MATVSAATMGTRAVLQVFEKYQKERVAFVSAVAELSKSPQVRKTAHAVRSSSFRAFAVYTYLVLQNVEALQQAGAMSLLRPLLLDNVPR